MNQLWLSIVCVLFSFSSLHSCQVIYINGTSSVGKTTIIKALLAELDEPHLHMGIDRVIEMMPEYINNWSGGHSDLGFSWQSTTDTEGHPLQLLQMGPFAKKMPLAMRTISSALAHNGFHLIIDDVAMEDGSFDHWKKALDGVDVLWVGFTAPIDIIEKREKERGDRLVGQARAAALIVHREFIYDLFLDTHATPLNEIVQKIKEACKKKSEKSTHSHDSRE